MRILFNGQQAFGRRVLETLVARGEQVVGVYSDPGPGNGGGDPVRDFALEKGLPLFQPRSFRRQESWDQLASLGADLCVMAYVRLFVPEEALNIPTHGSIQFHPSLLPRHRGGSAINWPVIWGESHTGLSVFWPDNGLDEGPLLMQKSVQIADDDTLGSLYFNKLFPMGVDAIMESVDLVREGKAPKIQQDHARATYEGWCRGELVEVNWHMPTQVSWNLIRGCDPTPDAWATFQGTRISLFRARKLAASTGARPGQITRLSDAGIQVATADGQILIQRLRPDTGKTMRAADWAAESGLITGARFG